MSSLRFVAGKRGKLSTASVVSFEPAVYDDQHPVLFVSNFSICRFNSVSSTRHKAPKFKEPIRTSLQAVFRCELLQYILEIAVFMKLFMLIAGNETKMIAGD